MNILFTCAGRRTYLLKYFKENLNDNDKVLATDMSLSAPALQVADVKIQVPAVYCEGYVERLLEICKQYAVAAVISLNDLELPILAAHKAEFEAVGTKVLVSDSAVIDLAFDKYKTAKWLNDLGVSAPKTYIKIEDVENALLKGEVEFPLFLKPRWGSGSIGLEVAEDLEELHLLYALLMKKIKKSILKTASVGDEYIIIQEKLTGNEYGIDIMNDLNGNYIAACAKQKLAMRSGETDKAVIVDIPELNELAKLIGTELKHVGNLDVDVMQRADGGYCILELNPRFGGGYPFSHEAGVNMPKAIIEWIKGNTVGCECFSPIVGKIYAKNDYLMEIR